MLTLTPQARAISAFTLAVLLVFGQLNKLALGFVLVFGSSWPDGRVGRFLTALLVIGVAGAVTFFAMQASSALEAGTAWDTHLARAAVLVAVVGLVIAIVLGIGSVANNDGGVPGGYGLSLFF